MTVAWQHSSRAAKGLRDAVGSLPDGALVVTVCNHGGPRSRGAAKTLRELGVASATHLVGGVKGPRAGH